MYGLLVPQDTEVIEQLSIAIDSLGPNPALGRDQVTIADGRYELLKISDEDRFP